MRDRDRDHDSDKEYNEAEDDDYNPNAVDAGSDSSSEDEVARTDQPARKRKTTHDDELDSGDEATIKERAGKRRKQDVDHEDSFIRTRAQRQAEIVEAKIRKRATIGRVTVDVDSLWSDLSRLPVGRPPTLPRILQNGAEDEEMLDEVPASETITIKRRVKFAGAVTEVEEEVARNSKEAQTYLAEQEKEKENQQEDGAESAEKTLRPLRRVSRFEPNPLGIVKGVAPEKLRRKQPSRVDLVMAERRQEEERAKRAEKLSTMQKTQLDWKGFVVEQGLGEELKEYGKSNRSFIAREEFLGKVHVVNEAARRTARLKG